MLAKCRHCAKPIERTGNGWWVDEDGFSACVKGGLWTDPLTGEVQSRLAVSHEPMPRTSTLGDQCPFCGGHSAWSSLDLDTAIYTAPPGHTVHRRPDGSQYDTCPRQPSSMAEDWS